MSVEFVLNQEEKRNGLSLSYKGFGSEGPNGAKCFVKYDNLEENWTFLGIVKESLQALCGYPKYHISFIDVPGISFIDVPGTFLIISTTRNKPDIYSDIHLSHKKSEINKNLYAVRFEK